VGAGWLRTLCILQCFREHGSSDDSSSCQYWNECWKELRVLFLTSWTTAFFLWKTQVYELWFGATAHTRMIHQRVAQGISEVRRLPNLWALFLPLPSDISWPLTCWSMYVGRSGHESVLIWFYSSFLLSALHHGRSTQGDADTGWESWEQRLHWPAARG
jgi:hypothetical protein